MKCIAVFVVNMNSGGIEKTISLLLPTWLELGYKIVLISAFKENEIDFKWNYDGVYREYVYRYLWDDIDSVKKQLRKIYKKYNVNIAIFNSWSSKRVFDFACFSHEFNIPFVVYTHNHYEELSTVPAYELWDIYRGYREADLVLCLTEDTCRLYKELDINAVFIQNPIDKQYADVERSELNSNTVLWVGRMHDIKNPAAMIETFKIIHDAMPEVRLQMVGEIGEDEMNVVDMVSRYGLEEVVKFEGFQKDVDRYYRNASVYVMTSKCEANPNTIIESKAHGLPCAMFELPNIIWCKNPKGIITSKQNDYSELAKNIIKIMQDKSSRNELGNQAYESIRDALEYDLFKVWKEILSIKVSDNKNIVYDYNPKYEFIFRLIKNSKERYEFDMKCETECWERKIGNIILKIPRIIQRYIDSLQ